MNPRLLVLIPWMVTLAAANPNGPRPAQVYFTHIGATHVRAWRIGDECWVQPSSVRDLGWRYSVTGAAVEITAGGQTATVGLRPGTREQLIPLREAVAAIGGLTAWREGSSKLDVFGLVQRLSLKDGKLSLTCSLSARPRLFTLSNPNRVVVDFEGVQLCATTAIDLPPNARVGQFKASVVRVTLETGGPISPKISEQPAAQFALALDKDGGPTTTTEVQPPTDTDIPPPVVLPTTTNGAVRAGPITTVTDSEKQAVVRIPLTKSLSAPPRFRRLDPVTIQIVLPGARYVPPDSPEPPSTPFSSVEPKDENGGTVLTLTLPRPMGVSFASMPAEVQIALFKPAVGNGRLAGKTIVVDPGHGGPDTGAKSLDGSVLEKDLNLAIGKLLAEELTAQGATVIMTRKSDVKIPLRERSEIANRNGADLFVSVHINSNKLANSRSGNMTFHHGGDPIGNVLAECVQSEIGKLSGLPNLGVWSDTRIYTSGFAVLRYAKMPAVLLELGFINHNKDLRRMTTADFQKRIAEAVVKGLKVYLGDGETEEKPNE